MREREMTNNNSDSDNQKEAVQSEQNNQWNRKYGSTEGKNVNKI